MAKFPKFEGWTGASLATLFLFAGAEVSLRIAGFQYSQTPLSMRYVRTIAHLGNTVTSNGKNFHIDYTLDPILLWRPVATAGFTNTEGFLGPEWTGAKPEHTRRLIALGDSCTVAGDTPYPERLQVLLAHAASYRNLGTSRWEVLNAGVGSWSSYQGMRLLETEISRYRPDYVSIYFGWNDHWLAWAAPDKELAALLGRQWRLRNWLNKSRLLEAFLWLATKIRGGPQFSRTTPFRVSAADYEYNLKTMVQLVRSIGAKPLLITAPTTLTPLHPVTLQLCRETHNFYEPGLINQVHDQYNAVVRRVANEMNVPLIDAAAEFEGAVDRESLFTDGIHFTAAGHQKMAHLLLNGLEGEKG